MSSPSAPDRHCGDNSVLWLAFMLRILDVTGLILVLEVTGWTLFPVAGYLWLRILLLYLSFCSQTLELSF
jgi:hypothetical protein